MQTPGTILVEKLLCTAQAWLQMFHSLRHCFCSDCQTALRPGLPPAEADQPDIEFVTIMESSDRLLIAMAKGLLEETGVFFYVCGDEIALRPGMSDALIHRGYTIDRGAPRLRGPGARGPGTSLGAPRRTGLEGPPPTGMPPARPGSPP